MASTGGILISACEGYGDAAEKLASALSDRGLDVRAEKGGGLPAEPVDVLVCFRNGEARDVSAQCLDVLKRDLARAIVIVSSASLAGSLPQDAPVIAADPTWEPTALARLTEVALVVAREREGRVRAEGRLGELAQAHEGFSAIVSHDLRTPVTTLRLLRDLLNSQLNAKADLLTRNERVSTDELLGIMSRSLDRMEAFIDDMLEAWRLSPGLPEQAPEPVGLNRVVGDVVAGLFPVAMQKDIVLDLATDPNVGLVLAEARRVGQVVSNLVGNALKFTPRGGSVTVSTRPASPEDGGDLPGGAVLEVADTGPGIAAEDREKIFRRFSRGKARATGGEPSTGLGLYICREVVELYGGRIWFESAPGKGSRFFVLFLGTDAAKPGRI